jgi:stage II sporulation protein AB (anti-sigma F factor)
MTTRSHNGEVSKTHSFSLQLRIPPLPRYVRSARGALNAFGTYHHIEPRDLENLTFALGEALANAIEHAHTQNDIAIGFQIDDSAVIATVSDQGRGLTTPPPNAARMPRDLTETGRGFAIMQRCTDFFDIRSAPGEGTVITMGRYRRR